MPRKLFKLILMIMLTTISVLTVTSSVSHADTVMRSKPNYTKSSEVMPYPDLNHVEHLNILVKIKQNRVYLRDDSHVIYTMYCSAGKIDQKTHQSNTPTGNFTIQSEHGNSFYNQSLKEGANYWTSFKDHGIYLFHTVPTDRNGHYKKQAAKLLGKRPDSHGCIRLSIPDAKFIQTVPVGTPVTIEQ